MQHIGDYGIYHDTSAFVRTRSIVRSNLLEDVSSCIIIIICRTISSMSEKPEERNRDSRKASENSIEQGAEPPLDKTDPTEPVRVGGAKAGKGTSTAL